MISIILLVSGCSVDSSSAVKGTGQHETYDRKESITEDETMDYFGRLLEPYVQMSNVKTNEQAYEALEKMKDNSTEINRELKRYYEKDIHAVNDLKALSDTFLELVNAAEDNILFISDYSDDVSNHIYIISTEYLDGNLPSNYAEIIGAENIYDLR